MSPSLLYWRALFPRFVMVGDERRGKSAEFKSVELEIEGVAAVLCKWSVL